MNLPTPSSPAPRETRARWALRRLLILAGVVALAGGGWTAWREWQARQASPAPARGPSPQPSAAEEAEGRALRERFIAASEAAHRAWIESTPPEVRKAQEAKALEEFRAAQNEVLLQQALAAQRRARSEGDGASAPIPGWVQAASTAQVGAPPASTPGAAAAVAAAPAPVPSPAVQAAQEAAGIEALQLKALQEMARKAKPASAPGPSNPR